MLPRTHQIGLCMVVALLAGVLALPALAQDVRQALTAADYERAEQFLGTNTNPLLLRAGVTPNWLPDERFWYRVTIAEGREFVLVDAASGTRAPAFDHARLAAGLSAAAAAWLAGRPEAAAN